MGTRSRATHVYPEAQDTIDLGLADTSHEATTVTAGGPVSWRFGRGQLSDGRPAYRMSVFWPTGGTELSWHLLVDVLQVVRVEPCTR